MDGSNETGILNVKVNVKVVRKIVPKGAWVKVTGWKGV